MSLTLLDLSTLFQSDPDRPSTLLRVLTKVGERPAPKDSPPGTPPTPMTAELPVLEAGAAALLSDLLGIDENGRPTTPHALICLADFTDGRYTAHDGELLLRDLRRVLTLAKLPGNALKVRPVYQADDLPWIILQCCQETRTLPRDTHLVLGDAHRAAQLIADLNLAPQKVRTTTPRRREEVFEWAATRPAHPSLKQMAAWGGVPKSTVAAWIRDYGDPRAT